MVLLPSRWILKIHGLTRPIIEEAIARTREARMHILDNVMRPVISEPRKAFKPICPEDQADHH